MRIPIILILIFFDNLVFAEDKPFSNPKYIEEYFCKVDRAYKIDKFYSYEEHQKIYEKDKNWPKPSKYFLDKYDLSHSAYSPFKLSIEVRGSFKKGTAKVEYEKSTRLPTRYYDRRFHGPGEYVDTNLKSRTFGDSMTLNSTTKVVRQVFLLNYVNVGIVFSNCNKF